MSHLSIIKPNQKMVVRLRTLKIKQRTLSNNNMQYNLDIRKRKNKIDCPLEPGLVWLRPVHTTRLPAPVLRAARATCTSDNYAASMYLQDLDNKSKLLILVNLLANSINAYRQ